MEEKISLPTLTCKRCRYSWTPRKTEVNICPHCKSPYWNKERTKQGIKANETKRKEGQEE